MPQYRAFLTMALSLLLLQGDAGLKAPDTFQTNRTLNIPGYTLKVSAEGRAGRVEVRKDSGAPVQNLICPLIEYESTPSDLQLKAAAETFVSDFTAEDLDLDGAMDLKGPREFGAKWSRYCVWLFNPRTHAFERDGALAEQMELLYNLKVDAKRGRILSYSIGPVDPMLDEYRIENQSPGRPYWPRLVPVQSCFIETGPAGNRVLIVTHYEHGGSVVRRSLGREDKHPLSVTGLCNAR